MLDLFAGRIFFDYEIKKILHIFHFFVDFLAIDMVYLYNGMVAKIIFLQPSHYETNITLISPKKQGSSEKKNRVFF